jgi:ABC-type transport system substrate-binding protein
MIYNAEPREAFDPTKNINKLLEEYSYSMSEDKDEEIIRKILEQMTEDAEIIPLFYQPSADFYNTDKLDVSDLYLTESMQFWKLKLKE